MTKGTLVANGVRYGFFSGILSTVIDVIVFRSTIKESLNYGIAVFAGTTAYLVTEALLPSEDEYINDRTEADS